MMLYWVAYWLLQWNNYLPILRLWVHYHDQSIGKLEAYASHHSFTTVTFTKKNVIIGVSILKMSLDTTLILGRGFHGKVNWQLIQWWVIFFFNTCVVWFWIYFYNVLTNITRRLFSTVIQSQYITVYRLCNTIVFKNTKFIKLEWAPCLVYTAYSIYTQCVVVAGQYILHPHIALGRSCTGWHRKMCCAQIWATFKTVGKLWLKSCLIEK